LLFQIYVFVTRAVSCEAVIFNHCDLFQDRALKRLTKSEASFVLRAAASKALHQAAAGALKGNHQGHASGQMTTPGKIFLAVAELELAAANLRSGRIAHGLIPLLIKRLRTYLPRQSIFATA
jgi:hypothetical protein